jgi:hypothetical protein
MLNDDTIEQLQSIDSIAWRCLKLFHFFEMVTNQSGIFWALAQNTFGENACLLWCHIFAKRSDDLHYNQFFARPDVIESGSRFSVASVKRRVLDRACLSSDEYDEFWKKMNDLRDQYISHRDLENPNPKFPDISICRDMMEELREILFELVLVNFAECPANEQLDQLRRFQSSHRSSELRVECEHEIEDGIQLFHTDWSA